MSIDWRRGGIGANATQRVSAPIDWLAADGDGADSIQSPGGRQTQSTFAGERSLISIRCIEGQIMLFASKPSKLCLDRFRIRWWSNIEFKALIFGGNNEKSRGRDSRFSIVGVFIDAGIGWDGPCRGCGACW